MFPRFYFIGDDDLLEILGQSTNPNVIQTHLKKLFAGIHSVQFDQDSKHIIAMKSLDGEVVPLERKVKILPEVEVRTIKFFYVHPRSWKKCRKSIKSHCIFMFKVFLVLSTVIVLCCSEYTLLFDPKLHEILSRQR